MEHVRIGAVHTVRHHTRAESATDHGMPATRDFFAEVARRTSTGETVAVATIVRTRGSTPREVGAKMLVRPGGTIVGTVGGGCGEADVWRAALTVIDQLEPTTVAIDLTEPIDMASQAVCGGILDVFVEPWTGSESSVVRPSLGTQELAAQIVAALDQKRAVALVTVVGGRGDHVPPIGAHSLVDEQGEVADSFGNPIFDRRFGEVARAAMVRDRATFATIPLDPADTTGSASDVFVEVFVPAPELLIVGAGHIAVPLARIASINEFDVTVLDDRAAYANRQRFPDAGQVIAADIQDTVARFPVSSRTHVVLVTRGHQQDIQALRTLIHSPARYIGMIGSKRRVWTVLKLMHDEGATAEELLRIHAPIGLDIEAITPPEIATAIMAEIIKVRRGGKAQSMSEPVRELFLHRLERQLLAEASPF